MILFSASCPFAGDTGAYVAWFARKFGWVPSQVRTERLGDLHAVMGAVVKEAQRGSD